MHVGLLCHLFLFPGVRKGCSHMNKSDTDSFSILEIIQVYVDAAEMPS